LATRIGIDVGSGFGPASERSPEAIEHDLLDVDGKDDRVRRHCAR
jgi:hypothetical protein